MPVFTTQSRQEAATCATVLGTTTGRDNTNLHASWEEPDQEGTWVLESQRPVSQPRLWPLGAAVSSLEAGTHFLAGGDDETRSGAQFLAQGLHLRPPVDSSHYHSQGARAERGLYYSSCSQEKAGRSRDRTCLQSTQLAVGPSGLEPIACRASSSGGLLICSLPPVRDLELGGASAEMALKFWG